ncbi:ChaB family protein [Egbenema bharatensis]|uniref:ChaB family protein n=1 Tax=Egbenema bharatensis TaxID=3463334 RepID=UPI003A877664
MAYEENSAQHSETQNRSENMENNAPENNLSENNSSEQGSNMNRLTIDNLPNDVKESLPEEAQSLYIAAYNSIIDSGNEESARQVAWQTIERNEHYARDDNGKWYRLPEGDGKRGRLSMRQLPKSKVSRWHQPSATSGDLFCKGF